jgi:hypothetical protein
MNVAKPSRTISIGAMHATIAGIARALQPLVLQRELFRRLSGAFEGAGTLVTWEVSDGRRKTAKGI